MKKFIIAVVLMVFVSGVYAMSSDIKDVNNKTGWYLVDGGASNISQIVIYSWPASMTLTVYDAALTQTVDATSNTLCYLDAQAFVNIAAADVYPITIDLLKGVAFDAAANFLTINKPFAIYKKALLGIVFKIDADTNSITGKVFITKE